MLRIHWLQQWFTLSDPAVEEALDDSRAMRGLVGIDLEREPVPDATTICTFRHLLEAHQMSAQLVAWIQEYLVAARLDDEPGTIVDAPASLLQLDEESPAGTRSEHAPDEEWPPVVLRHDDPSRRGQPAQADPCGLPDGGRIPIRHFQAISGRYWVLALTSP